MTGPMVKLPEDEDTPEKVCYQHSNILRSRSFGQRVTKLFSLMDKDENGSISFEEFEKGCQEDKTIADALNKYTGGLSSMLLQFPCADSACRSSIACHCIISVEENVSQPSAQALRSLIYTTPIRIILFQL